MNDLDGTLIELAKLRSGSEPIVSLYLDLRWHDEQQRERVRLFVQDRVRRTLGHYPAGSPGRPALARTLRRVADLAGELTGQAHESSRSGLALFACESLSLWRPLYFARPFENRLATDGIPHLLPLATLQDDFAPALVVAPSQEGADIYEVQFGELDVETNLRGFVPRRGDEENQNPGAARVGEREEKDRRHRDAFVQKNRRAAAAETTVLFDQTPGARVVLVGPSGTLAAFERELPPRVREAVVARLHRPREWESADGARRAGVVRDAAEAVLRREREDEAHVVEAVVGQALRGGLAVLGPADVVLAVNEGRVHRLVMEADLQLTGWRCDNCQALGANAESAEVCPWCAGDLRAVRDLGEALVGRALATGASVEVVPHANRLHGYRGVAAFLRQTTPTGLRGASQPWPTAPGANQP